MTNEEVIWQFLNKRLNNPYGTAALMGNLFAESSLDPMKANGIKKYGMTGKEYTEITDTGKNNKFITDGIAYGLAQWCFHTRKQALLEYARKTKRSVGDINMQLEYLWQELQSYKTVINSLYSAKTIREASDVVLLRYEKPANKSEAVKEKRARFGQKYFDKYNGIKLIVTKEYLNELLNELGDKLK